MTSEKDKNVKHFQNSWLEDDLCKDFFGVINGVGNKFRCIVCKKALSLSTEGRLAFERHV